MKYTACINFEKKIMNEIRYNPIHINGYNYLFHWDRICDILDNHKHYLARNYKITYPITIEIDPIDYCNHSCIWCFTYSHRKTSLLNSSVLENLLEELKKNDVRSIHFSGGGEATLYNGLIRKHGNRKNNKSLIQKFGKTVTLGLITNGSILDKLDVDDIVQNLKWIRFSVDAGTNERYEKVHKPLNHNLDIVHNNIKEIVGIRGDSVYPVIGCSFIYERNDEEIREEILAFAKRMSSLSVDYIQVKPENNNRSEASKRFANVIEKDIEDVLEQKNMFATIDRPYPIKGNSDFCWYSYFGPVVGATGGVYVCCSKYGQDNFKYGVVNSKNSFEKIWNSKERINFVKNIETRNCQSCRHNRFNVDIEKLYRAGKEVRKALSIMLTSLKAGIPFRDINIPKELFYLQNGLKHFEIVTRLGYNRIIDFPVYRETKIICGWNERIYP